MDNVIYSWENKLRRVTILRMNKVGVSKASGRRGGSGRGAQAFQSEDTKPALENFEKAMRNLASDST